MAFSFWNIFLILEIFAFLYYANEESDDGIGGSTKTVQHRLSLYYQISKQCPLNLAPELYITKVTKWSPSCHCHDNNYAVGPF